ncbi:MAG TPA: XdhC/CoxI family protein [Candidatus Dormibacteraeota bacterium]|nr:XdhC/CoxI family protein [Candidatus Dormibacteraeota bacterium]
MADRDRDTGARGRRAATVTVTDLEGEPPSRRGMTLTVLDDGTVQGTLGCDGFDRAGVGDAMRAMDDGVERRAKYDWDERSRIAVVVRPSRGAIAEAPAAEAELLVVGAGAVARALVTLGKAMGYRVRVVTGPFERGPHDFDAADEVLEWTEPTRLRELPIGENTYVVICGHDDEFSQPAMRALLPSAASYLGMMGSRRHTGHLLEELRAAGFSDEQVARVHSPVGLSIGAETPEEIALSAISEIVAVRRAQRSNATIGR